MHVPLNRMLDKKDRCAQHAAVRIIGLAGRKSPVKGKS